MDVKRLKVTELRAELGRRGLDSRGLKVELAQRLQEALDAEMLAAGPEEGTAGTAAGASSSTVASAAGICPAGESGAAAGPHGAGDEEEEEEEEDEEEEEEEEEEDEETLLADEEESAGATTGAAGAVAAVAPGEGEGAQPGPPRPAGEEEEEEAVEEEAATAAAAGPPVEQQQQEQPQPEAEPQGPEEASGGVNGAERPQEEGPSGDEASAATEPKDEGAQGGDEEDKGKAAGSDGERRGVKRQRDEKDEHGRAYYEFREEAYNSRSKSPPPPEEEPREGEEDESLVILDTYTSDLQFRASRDRYGGQPLFFEKFPGLWAGARSTHGVTGGRVCFEAKVTQYLPLKEGTTEVPLFRVGWSVDFSHSQLGEDEMSFGFDSRGLKVANGEFQSFGETFGEGDVIGCFADFEAEEEVVELSFSKNGEALGAAFQVSRSELGSRALLPHVLCRGCSVELNFGQKDQPLCPPIPDGFVFIASVPPELRVRTPLPPKTTQECEVLLMVGLPGSGKTQWAQGHSRENRDKRFLILGTETVLHQMRPKGPEVEELDAQGKEQLLQRAAQCLSKLVQIAPRAKRNFILDQCNVYNSGQRRKLLPFKGFSRRVVVVVPPEEEWRRRLQLRTQAEGDGVPDCVMLEMKANFSVPEPGELVDEVLFAELPREQAQPLVGRLREEARKLLPPPEKRGNRRNNRNKRNRQNRSRGQGYLGGQRRGYESRVYGQQQYWGQPGNRGGYRNFYDRYRGDYDRFYGRDYDYNRYRDYYRQYNREWQNYYQDRDRYYRNYYGYQGYR
ncbi:HNRPU protein, partial [Rhinopomastus cyanomelas]|nr:HNRPU protein [Rhinopomastus cyanomelas]